MPHKLDTDERVYFYEQEFYVLSNFSAFMLYWRGLWFHTSEAAYQWEKFVGVHHPGVDVAHRIHQAPSAHEAYQIARDNKSIRRPDWDNVKIPIMLNILRAKAEQHEYVRRKLVETGDRYLIEDSWRDPFWGSDPEWPSGTGSNWLGRLWMIVRAERLIGERLVVLPDHMDQTDWDVLLMATFPRLDLLTSELSLTELRRLHYGDFSASPAQSYPQGIRDNLKR